MDEGLAKIRHDRSQKDFPFLHLGPTEYVEFAFKRARASLLLLLGGLGGGLAIILLVFLLVLMSSAPLEGMGQNFLYIILGILIFFTVMAAIISIVIYRGNRLFITNEHIIQMSMSAPMATSVNMIDLFSIEVVIFHQNGFIQKIFGFGTLRLATVGDETTYTFKDSDISSDELNSISKLITAAKAKSTTDQPNPKA